LLQSSNLVADAYTPDESHCCRLVGESD
jgi:hypothetical protein